MDKAQELRFNKWQKKVVSEAKKAGIKVTPGFDLYDFHCHPNDILEFKLIKFQVFTNIIYSEMYKECWRLMSEEDTDLHEASLKAHDIVKERYGDQNKYL